MVGHGQVPGNILDSFILSIVDKIYGTGWTGGELALDLTRVTGGILALFLCQPVHSWF